METGRVTTPFGRRPMTLALVRAQTATADIKIGKTVEKWKIFRDVSTAMARLGIQSNSLAVLDALLSFYPRNELSQDAQMIVFPSNVQLSLRAHGMAPATIRRHVAVLVDAGLIVRRDSANGKRYVRKDAAGQIESAFGFDLSPLLARSDELALLAQDVLAERTTLSRARESLTICRRDVRKLITAAIEEGAPGNWNAIEDVYVGLVSRIPRSPSLSDVNDILDEMTMLQEEVINRLKMIDESANDSISAAQTAQHIQNSKPESLPEFEEAYEKKPEGKSKAASLAKHEPMKAVTLSMVLRGCPAILDYGPQGRIENWRDLMKAAVVVRSMLGVSASAYEDACAKMGPENAATAMTYILERANVIRSAGGYLRDLTQRAERDEFSVAPMIMALMRANDGMKRMAP